MNVVFCWSHLSGYMAACWRQLAAVPGVTVTVLAFESDPLAPFGAGLLGGVRHTLLDEARRQDADAIRRLVADAKPDVIMTTGWSHGPYRQVVKDPAFRSAHKVLGLDTPYRGDARQAIGRRLLRPLLRRYDRVAVPGERGVVYAKYLGFAPSQIRRGLYGFDYAAFASAHATRQAKPWPKRLLYAGRYAAEKDIDTLAAGYARYKAMAGDAAWDLVTCGRGPEAAKLAAVGAKDLGFVAPPDQPAAFAEAGAFVIASRYEPWGVAIAEAAASGLPLVCSDACGAAADVVRDAYNGYTFPAGDPAALARRLCQVTAADLPAWGGRSQALAEAYSASTWPARVFDDLLPGAAAQAAACQGSA